MFAYTDISDFLEHGGAVVAGGTAFGWTTGFVVGTVIRDIGVATVWGFQRGWDLVRPTKLAERVAAFGGVFGLGTVLERLIFGA